MIILEGPDCGGKTHLMKRLINTFGIHKSKHYDRHDPTAMLKHAVRSRPGTREIVDRFHISHIPYDSIYRRKTPKYYSIRMIDRALLARDAIVITCLPPLVTIESVWKDRRKHELINDWDVMRQIYTWYHDATHTLPHLIYDWVHDDYDELIHSIIGNVGYPTLDIEKGEGAGYPRGMIMLVGEIVGNSDQFEVPFAGDISGAWLTNKLIQADIYESELFWINCKRANGVSNMENVIAAYHENRCIEVFALGMHAHEALETVGIPHKEFPHPSYWRRFKANKQYPFIQYLKETIHGAEKRVLV